MVGRSYKTSLLITILFVASKGLGCPTFWIPFENNCYRFFGELVDLQQARFNCRSHGGGSKFAYLASIHSQEENDFISTLYKSYTDSAEDGGSWHVWIGLNDEKEEGTYVWSDGSVVNFTAWAHGQPNGGTSELGVNMPHPHHRDYPLWHDRSPTARNKYICKMPKYP